MSDMTKVVANALGEHLALTYRHTFGSRDPRYAEIIEASARLMIERIVGSDALYHDGDHTTLVTLVAQDILRGRFLQQGVTPEDWLHMIVAALYHDIGYVRGVCSGDRADAFVIDAQGHDREPAARAPRTRRWRPTTSNVRSWRCGNASARTTSSTRDG